LQQQEIANKLLRSSDKKKRWTIGVVNFKTIVYLKYQLKILYELNDPEDFNLIIVDNSNPHETKELENLKKEFNSYNNIKIFYHTPTKSKSLKGSLDHAEGLNIILNETKTDYLLVQDPDFFWVQKEYLKQLEMLLLKGNVSVGAPYEAPIKIGKPNFPAAFGCAYIVKAIKDNNLDFDIGKTYEEVVINHKDVGWKIRNRLSSELFTSFEQKKCDITKYFNKYSFDNKATEYFLNKRTIAFHLYRGSFIGNESQHKSGEFSSDLKVWMDSRKRYAEFFYLLAQGGDRDKIIKKITL
jgi:hypothetical protein